MKLKKSEYRAMRKSFWFASVDMGGNPQKAEILADRDVLAAEAAGAEWEPEEVPLPKRLIAYHAMDCSGKFNMHLGADDGSAGWMDAKHQEAGYNAAVNAYNRLQAGELVEKFMPSGKFRDYTELQCLADRYAVEAAEASSALHRLALKAAVPDEGPDEIVGAVLESLQSLRQANKDLATGVVENSALFARLAEGASLSDEHHGNAEKIVDAVLARLGELKGNGQSLSYTFLHKDKRWRVHLYPSGSPAIEPVRLPTSSILPITAACAEILALAEQRKNLFQERNAQDKALLKGMEEREALAKRVVELEERLENAKQHARYLGRTQEEQEELIAEARFGMELVGILRDNRGERGECEGTVETLQRIIRERNAFESHHHESPDARLGRALWMLIEPHRRSAESYEDALRRIIRERDQARADWERAIEKCQETEGARLIGLREIRHLKSAKEAAESENRAKSLELADKAGDIRELRRAIDEAVMHMGIKSEEIRALREQLRVWQLRARSAEKLAGLPSDHIPCETRPEEAAKDEIRSLRDRLARIRSYMEGMWPRITRMASSSPGVSELYQIVTEADPKEP